MIKLVKKYKLQGKTASHTKSLARSLVLELVISEKIKTTKAKASVIKSQFDKLVTAAKKNTDSGKRVVESFFSSNQRSIDRFYSVVNTKLQDRNSGYTRIFRTMPRKGDGAEQVYIMLTSFTGEEEKSSVSSLLEKRKQSKKKGAKKPAKKSE